MNKSSRISILLPVTLVLVWITLICLAMPGFAVAAAPDRKHSVDQVSAINPGSDLGREVRSSATRGHRVRPGPGVSAPIF